MANIEEIDYIKKFLYIFKKDGKNDIVCIFSLSYFSTVCVFFADFCVFVFFSLQRRGTYPNIDTATKDCLYQVHRLLWCAPLKFIFRQFVCIFCNFCNFSLQTKCFWNFTPRSILTNHQSQLQKKTANYTSPKLWRRETKMIYSKPSWAGHAISRPPT